MSRQLNAAGKGERQLVIRPSASPLDRILPAADDVQELIGIAHRAQRYIRANYSPDHREPGCIVNRRDELSCASRARDARLERSKQVLRIAHRRAA